MSFIFLLLIVSGSFIHAEINQEIALYRLTSLSVYEVVRRKGFDTPQTIEKKIAEGREDEIIEDNFSYNRKLNWDKVDYISRTDEFYSIGTAFAISENRLLTAAHVFDLATATYLDQLAIRDSQGAVYPVDQIFKYDNQRDFVEFSVLGKDDFVPLVLKSEFELYEPVYSVGNALGEGIVLRDGLLTSTTPENENGEWNYLRFSAAASPGNSGGPLINGQGEVLGIILRKSSNENLNYAIPIVEVTGAVENRAFIHDNYSYRLIITRNKYGPEVYEQSFQLPLHYNSLREQLVAFRRRNAEHMLGQLLAENSSTFFPQAPDSWSLFYTGGFYENVQIAGQDENNNWAVFRPGDIKQGDIDGDGSLSYGYIAQTLFATMEKPDSVGITDYITDSELFMDSFLQAFPLQRNVGGEEIRITSIGQAMEQWQELDRYGRVWFFRSWPLRFADQQITLALLPTPEGFYCVGTAGSYDAVSGDELIDLREYLNYLFLSYNGTFGEWQQFLRLPKNYLPAFFNDIELSYDDSTCELHFPDYSLRFNSRIQSINAESSLNLKVGYRKQGEQVNWLPEGILVYENNKQSSFISIINNERPLPGIRESIQTDWQRLVSRTGIYDSALQINNGNSVMVDIIDSRGELLTGGSDPQEIYTFYIGRGGTHEEEEMRSVLDRLIAGFSVN